MLAKEAIRIMQKVKGPGGEMMISGIQALLSVAILKNDYGDEKKSIFEDFSREAIREYGVDGKSTAHAHRFLGHFYVGVYNAKPHSQHFFGAKRERLQLCESSYKEVMRINTESYAPNHLRSSEIEAD
jgi:hypothetical protein